MNYRHRMPSPRGFSLQLQKIPVPYVFPHVEPGYVSQTLIVHRRMDKLSFQRIFQIFRTISASHDSLQPYGCENASTPSHYPQKFRGIVQRDIERTEDRDAG